MRENIDLRFKLVICNALREKYDRKIPMEFNKGITISMEATKA